MSKTEVNHNVLRSVFVFLIGSLIIELFLSGCGVYTFNPHGKSSIKTISIDPFDNKTAEYGFTDQLTDIVTDAFIRDGSLKVVPAASAEALLTGVLLRYERGPARFDQNDQVSAYKVQLEFEIALRNPKDQTDIWKDRFTQEDIYDAATETEADAQKRVADKLVQAIITRTTKSW